MASPLMSPPHNGTPFIYFTERMSSVISTALKSYYLNVNDEWIDRGCQEQYLFVCPGQPWLFLFNSIPPLPLSVIDNWCDVTLTSEDVEFLPGKNTPGWLVIARWWAAAAKRFVVLASMSQVTTWHWWDPQGAGGLTGRKLPLSPLICPQTVPPWPCRWVCGHMPFVSVKWCSPGWLFFYLFVLWLFFLERWANCEDVLQIGNLGWAQSLWFNTEGSRDRAQKTVLHNTARGKIQTSTFFPLTSIDRSSSPERRLIPTADLHMCLLAHALKLHLKCVCFFLFFFKFKFNKLIGEIIVLDSRLIINNLLYC